MLTCLEHEDTVDIHISGVLDQPFNIRKLTHATTSDLFVPKLKDYFERKSLNSFVIKKSITPEHFESFIDVMSEPVADLTDGSKLGEYLTQALADLNITEISTVFKSDVVLSRGKLPWRVSIILRRLAKDLKVVPLFRQASEEKIKSIKKQIVEDIIRPLNHTGLLRDLIVNCDVIVEHVHHLMEVDELETTIIDSLPMAEVLPVARAVYDFYREFVKEASGETDEESRTSRKAFLRKMLKIAVKKIVAERLPGVQDLLDPLYEDNIINEDDLPDELRFNLETRKLADKILVRLDDYLAELKSSSAQEAVMIFNALQRVMVELIRQKEWGSLDKIIQTTKESYTAIEPDSAKSSGQILDALFSNAHDAFAHQYVQVEPEERKKMNTVLLQLNEMSIRIVEDILNLSKDPDVLRNIAEILSKKGKTARQWSLKILEDQNQPVSMLNIALIVLTNVGESGDVHFLKKYLKYPNPSIRIRSLAASAKLNKQEAEQYVLEALQDDDEKVRENAAAVMEHDIIPSELSANKIILFVKSSLQEKKHLSPKDISVVATLIKTIAKNNALACNQFLENEILDIASTFWKGRTGVLKFIKAAPTSSEEEIVSACLATLGKIGTEKSQHYIMTFARANGMLAHAAQKALAVLHDRMQRQ